MGTTWQTATGTTELEGTMHIEQHRSTTQSRLRANLPALLLAVLAAVVLAACGGDNDEVDASDSSSDGDTFESPLSDYMGFDNDFSFDENTEAAIQEQIVSCMSAEGFEYTPQVSDASVFNFDEPIDGVERDSREYAEKYGFGITTEAFPQSAVGPNLVGHNRDDFAGFGPDGDPNAEYVNSLSPSEQEAYYSTLYGDFEGPEIDESMTEDEIDAAFEAFEAENEPTGCFNEAYDEVFGDGNQEAFYEEFGDRMDSLYEDLENHPRIVAFEQELGECVADTGLTYTGQSDLYDTYYEKLSPIEESYWNAIDQAMMSVEFDENGNPPEGFKFPEPELDQADKDALGELQAEETALAVAVYDCGGTEADAGELYQEIFIEIEQQFIEDNRAELDAFKEANA
jgi:hypothetical protein